MIPSRPKGAKATQWSILGAGDTMSFKDYIIDRLLYIIFYYISTALVILIMGLDLIIRGEQPNLGNILYALLISTVILGLSIGFDYYKKRRVYQVLKNKPDDDSFDYIFNIPDNISREHEAFKRILTDNYMYFENTLDEYRRKFKTQVDYKSRWVHQMKTPISVIKLILENEKDRELDQITRKSYESIEEELEKLSHGLEMELYSLKINDFEMDFKVEEVDVLEIARSVINENKNAFIVNSIYPKIKSQSKQLVKSDGKWLKFIVSQIVSNAIKYTRVKDVENRYLHVYLHREADRTILSIEDNGVGIPRKDVDRVFRPFFSGENGRRYKESTGMGLYLTKEICDRLGHGIGIQSEEGKGTRVNITFYEGRSIYDLRKD